MVLPTIVSQPENSFRSLIGAFVLTKLTEGKSPRTIEFYTENLRRFVWYAENHNWPENISDITQWHVKSFLGYVAIEKSRWGIRGNGSETSRGRASQATVRHYYNVLKRFYSWLVEEGILDENLMDRIHVAKPTPPILVFFIATAYAIEKLLSTVITLPLNITRSGFIGCQLDFVFFHYFLSTTPIYLSAYTQEINHFLLFR